MFVSEWVDLSRNGIATPRSIQSLQSLLVGFLFLLKAQLLHLFLFLLQLEEGHAAVSSLSDGRSVGLSSPLAL